MIEINFGIEIIGGGESASENIKTEKRFYEFMGAEYKPPNERDHNQSLNRRMNRDYNISD